MKFEHLADLPGISLHQLVKWLIELDYHLKPLDENAPIPSTAKEIVDEYKRASENMLKEINNKWRDDTLLLEDDMYGEMWAKGKTLGVLVTHQIHHRGQLSVVMRLAGLKVPGVYGPAKEEWAGYGMEPQE
ncbi:MAG: DinB family protein [Ignavibacteriaceae bacterium]|nr:DinB family protein [Ignavibacteriaceae bacterium]